MMVFNWFKMNQSKNPSTGEKVSEKEKAGKDTASSLVLSPLFFPKAWIRTESGRSSDLLLSSVGLPAKSSGKNRYREIGRLQHRAMFRIYT